MKLLKRISKHVPSVLQAIASLIGVLFVAITTQLSGTFNYEDFAIILIVGWIGALLMLSAFNFLVED